VNLLLVGELDASEQAQWAQALRQAMPTHSLALTRAELAGARVDAAIVANPPAGSLADLPGLRLIQSLWAGVDRLLADATVPPDVPLARMVDPAMNQAMAETALWATLALHRGFFSYAINQRAAQWLPHDQRRADEVPVLVLGYGQMGQMTAQRLAQQGYPVTAWRRDEGRPGTLHPGVHLIAGSQALRDALGQAQVLINLLPLTIETRGILGAPLLDRLPAGAGLVNLARGVHMVEADVLAALDSGRLGHAVLDVFGTEPLPPDHPFWRHPRATVLPHAAAMTDARSAAQVVARNVDALAAGRPLAHLVARDRGY
jgi:glyoxylate/hydroxypyruvate reductase A